MGIEMSKRTVVVVDDEPIVRMDLSSMLEEAGFLVVGEAGDGFDAVSLCRARRPDVVLLDVKMPVFDGLSAAEIITRESLAGCVVLLTAYGDQGTVDRAKEVGVSGYLLKPVEQRMLLPTLEVALEQSRRLRRSYRETELTRRQLEESNLIRRAQGILAKQEAVSETQAYQLLQRMSMEKRISMGQLAAAVLEQERHRDDVARAKNLLMRKKGLSESAAYKRLSQRAAHDGCTREEAARSIRQELEGLD